MSSSQMSSSAEGDRDPDSWRNYEPEPIWLADLKAWTGPGSNVSPYLMPYIHQEWKLSNSELTLESFTNQHMERAKTVFLDGPACPHTQSPPPPPPKDDWKLLNNYGLGTQYVLEPDIEKYNASLSPDHRKFVSCFHQVPYYAKEEDDHEKSKFEVDAEETY